MSEGWFEQSFVFYLSYHSDKTNQLIHIFCVWPILFTAQLLLSYTAAVVPTNSESLAAVLMPQGINWCFLVSLVYFFYYLVVEQPGVAGPVASLLVLLGYYGTSYTSNYYQSSTGAVVASAILIHVGCWALQIYGHKKYEKRSPALLDNLVQAFLMAPLFVLMEVMFMLGYKQEFLHKVQKSAQKNIEEFRAISNKSK